MCWNGWEWVEVVFSVLESWLEWDGVCWNVLEWVGMGGNGLECV